eukprot:2846199-Pleurochrysis_carterae.AAC.1
MKANEGQLYPLDKCFFFVASKPARRRRHPFARQAVVLQWFKHNSLLVAFSALCSLQLRAFSHLFPPSFHPKLTSPWILTACATFSTDVPAPASYGSRS